ncbi:hypothetical protein Cpir12675_005837 [Ceratocystis pirilliformis]|uniref:Uncharacterized protein n=1 Tax=Ceratocystis pirilliformis TaxID=259994 RepID=A0ABR3YND3_9PEZI
MNWTEGNLARHARPQQRHSSDVKQKKHFAKLRAGMTSGIAELSSKSFNFLPASSRPLDLPPPPLHSSTASPPRAQIDASSRGPKPNMATASSTITSNAPLKRRNCASGDVEAPDINDRRKRLLLSSDWVGVGRPSTDSQHAKSQFPRSSMDSESSRRQSQNALPRISAFFVESKRRSRSPVHHFGLVSDVGEPRVHIGNQSLRGTSLYSAAQSFQYSPPSDISNDWPSYSSHAPMDCQMSSSRWSSPEPPQCYVESSPIPVHQPLPQRHRKLYEAHITEEPPENASSSAAIMGKSLSSSVCSDPDVIGEWKAFLGFSNPSGDFYSTESVSQHEECIYESVESDEPIQLEQHNHQSHGPLVAASGTPSIAIPTPRIVDETEPFVLSSDPDSGILSSPAWISPDPEPQQYPSITDGASALPEQERVEIRTVRLSFSGVIYQSGSPRKSWPATTRAKRQHGQNSVESMHIQPQSQADAPQNKTPVDELQKILPASAEQQQDDTCSEDGWMAFVFGSKNCDRKDEDALEEAVKQTSRDLMNLGSMDSDAANRGSPQPAKSTESWERGVYRHFSPSTSATDLAQAAESLPSTSDRLQISLPQSEAPWKDSADTISTAMPSDDISTHAQQGSPNGLAEATSAFRFSHPKLFVGRLSSAPNTASKVQVGGSRPSAGDDGGKDHKRRRVGSAKRAKSTDGRPDIRSLPNFEDDPIEE